ncbi:glycosyltransferase family 4 protein [Burkholderia cenocepacia]|nr:glycosyltransferase family 4 protein [Burkholderia cenocepacia]MDR8051315.1 glycosyltransferase family 4 protein [Burkholderia cenocepacia]
MLRLTTLLGAAIQFIAIWLCPCLVQTARRTGSQSRGAACSTVAAPPQLLVDVSILASNDSGTGIQRVTRSIVSELLRSPPEGMSVRPVRAARNREYRYADVYLSTQRQSDKRSDIAPVEIHRGDIFLGLDLSTRIVPRRQFDFAVWKRHGASCLFVVYDLLPADHPDWFPPKSRRRFRRWLRALATNGDAIFCISHTVAIDVRRYMDSHFSLTPRELDVDWFHLGADLPRAANGSMSVLPDGLTAPGRILLLMVGTIEPRKGHAAALDAMEHLWSTAAGASVSLVIVGRHGWRTEELVRRLHEHHERGNRLHWLPDIDDSVLQALYRHADGLIMASEAEGFGLPIVEAAHFGLPLLLRDIPVFREIAGPHAAYFSGIDAEDLPHALRVWVEQIRAGSAPCSFGIATLAWADSARQLKQAIERHRTKFAAS